MGVQGRKLAEERYSWSRVADELQHLFKSAEETKQVIAQQGPDNPVVEAEELTEQALPEPPSATPRKKSKQQSRSV